MHRLCRTELWTQKRRSAGAECCRRHPARPRDAALRAGAVQRAPGGHRGLQTSSYLPAGVGTAEVAEVVADPLADRCQGEFGLLAAFHGHADEGGVGVGRLEARVAPVVGVPRGRGGPGQGPGRGPGRRRGRRARDVDVVAELLGGQGESRAPEIHQAHQILPDAAAILGVLGDRGQADVGAREAGQPQQARLATAPLPLARARRPLSPEPGAGAHHGWRWAAEGEALTGRMLREEGAEG